MSALEAEPPVPEELVLGKYKLTRLLGRGGMGSVWEGVHTSLGARVAVKFIDSEYANSSEARSRFENEARAAATLRSKHVVQIYDHGLLPDGRPFIVMEFLAGEPLDKRLDRVERLPAQDTARIMQQVCRALARAHEAGIVHRDLKPENVFLVWDEDDGTDIAKVVDFGIAKFTDKSLGVSSSTRTGSVLGTPYYMSPEQARGLRSVDYRSDLWSVGVIAFRCIVGRLPFEGEAIGDLLVKICTAPLPLPSQMAPGVPPAFDAWFNRALSREPEQRFTNATELADSLCMACGISPGRPRSQSAEETGRHASAAAAQHAAHGSWGQYATPGHGGMHTPGSQAVSAPSPGALTGGSFTQTPAVPLRGSSKGPIIAAAIAALLVVGIGLAVVAKLVSRSLSPEAASASVDSAAPPSAAVVAPPAEPPVVEPSLEPSGPAKEDKPEATTSKPAASAITARPVAPRPRPGPVKPRVEEKPAPKPVPGVRPPAIDVGY